MPLDAKTEYKMAPFGQATVYKARGFTRQTVYKLVDDMANGLQAL